MKDAYIKVDLEQQILLIDRAQPEAIGNIDRVYNCVDMPILIVDITGNYMDNKNKNSKLPDVLRECQSKEYVNIKGKSCFQCCKRYSIFPQFICSISDGASPTSLNIFLTNMGA